MNDTATDPISVVVDGPNPDLVVDFALFSDHVTLASALSAAHPDRPLCRVDAVAAVGNAGFELERAAALCVDQMTRSGLEPETILGYCSAAGLALHIAAELARRGRAKPPVLLVEPSWSTPELIRLEADELLGGESGAYRGPDDVDSIVAALSGRIERQLAADGLDDEEIEICLEVMTQRHREWFGFLAAAAEADVPPDVLPAGMVLAQGGSRASHARWLGAPIRVQRLPGTEGSLLDQPETAAAIEDLRKSVLTDPPADPGYRFGPPSLADDRTRVSDLLLASFARTPQAAAVTDEHETIDYAELHRRALNLAGILREHGVGRDGVVAICAQRSVSLCVSIVAVLLSGGAYLPLDPDWPRARLDRILDEAAPRAVLADERGTAALGQVSQAPLLGLDGSGSGSPAEAAAESADAAAAGPDPDSPSADDLAYVIYTSGSTGRPKGVAVAHRGVVNRLLWMQGRVTLGVGDVVLQKTPYTFDISVWEFLWPLISGARLVMARPEGHRDPEYLAEVIRAERITVTHFVPSMLAVFLSAVEPGTCPSLRHVVCSGEALTAPVANRFTAEHDARLYNLYGPTEATIEVTAWTCRRPEPDASVPIGVPISGVLTAVRDARGRPVADGELGELHLGGDCLARGYLRRPDLTDAVFIDDPFAPGVRLYRTGDLVRRDTEGVIRYFGRADDQVKLAGVRIELGEIESTAVEYAGVDNAAAVVRQDGPGSARLALYVAPRLSGEAVAGLREHLRAQLPAAFLPAVIVPLAELPVTANGKCDRAALPAPPRAGEGRGASRRPTRREQ